MVLTKFVELKHVQEKFNAEFNPAFDNRYKPKFYTKTPFSGRKSKQNIGIYFEILKGNVILICDSYRRQKMITSIDDLIKFFTCSKYRNVLCWFYHSSFDFKTLMKYLPKRQLKELETSGETKYYVYKVAYKEKNFFQINFQSNYYKFYNLFPFFNLPLDDAALKYLNCHSSDSINRDNLMNDVNYWNDNQYWIANNCIKKAKLVRKLADYYIENNNDQNPIIHKKIINVPKTTNYTLVGTAFDYLFQFLIKAHNPKAITHSWRAERSLDILKGREKKIAKSIIETAKKRYDRFLDEKEINDDLIISSLLLAKIDGVVWGNNLEDISLDVNPADVDDLRNLITGVPKSVYLAKNHCFLNPTFGPASILVGGADADLVIDNILIDIKTTKNPKFTRLFFNQLMGYVILHNLGRLYSNDMKKIDPKGIFEDIEYMYGDFDKAFLNTRIEKIGIYFSRSNYLYTIDLKNVLPEGEINLEFLKWFEHEAHKAYQPMILDIFKMKKFFK